MPDYAPRHQEAHEGREQTHEIQPDLAPESDSDSHSPGAFPPSQDKDEADAGTLEISSNTQSTLEEDTNTSFDPPRTRNRLGPLYVPFGGDEVAIHDYELLNLVY
jgi:hypothetical protein